MRFFLCFGTGTYCYVALVDLNVMICLQNCAAMLAIELSGPHFPYLYSGKRLSHLRKVLISSMRTEDMDRGGCGLGNKTQHAL